MAKLLLTYHGYRKNKPDDENELRALFLFTLMPESEVKAGIRPDHTKTFWTEVRLSRDLAARGRWAALSGEEKLKAMLRFAEERIQEAGRKLREAHMVWSATSPLRDGPPWDLAGGKLRQPHIVEVEGRDAPASAALSSRKAAGLLA
jgi:hypothetical protein